MIPIDDKKRQIILDALDALGAGGYLTGAEFEALTAFKDGIESGRYVAFDTRPRCMVKEKGEQCEGHGKLQPFVFVYVQNNPAPVAQMDIKPIIRVCEKHATPNVADFLPRGQWSEIAQQVMRTTKAVALYQDAKVMFLDHEAQTIVPPTGIVLHG